MSRGRLARATALDAPIAVWSAMRERNLTKSDASGAVFCLFRSKNVGQALQKPLRRQPLRLGDGPRPKPPRRSTPPRPHHDGQLARRLNGSSGMSGDTPRCCCCQPVAAFVRGGRVVSSSHAQATPVPRYDDRVKTKLPRAGDDGPVAAIETNNTCLLLAEPTRASAVRTRAPPCAARIAGWVPADGLPPPLEHATAGVPKSARSRPASFLFLRVPETVSCAAEDGYFGPPLHIDPRSLAIAVTPRRRGLCSQVCVRVYARGVQPPRPCAWGRPINPLVPRRTVSLRLPGPTLSFHLSAIRRNAWFTAWPRLLTVPTRYYTPAVAHVTHTTDPRALCCVFYSTETPAMFQGIGPRFAHPSQIQAEIDATPVRAGSGSCPGRWLPLRHNVPEPGYRRAGSDRGRPTFPAHSCVPFPVLRTACRSSRTRAFSPPRRRRASLVFRTGPARGPACRLRAGPAPCKSVLL